ncbi:formate hydrogenlyase subunit 3/multisubunit Na+/H+ antiporter MnhD subunit [Desulfobaculum xiamenense]|uniref:Formate hydrogenlyase subunit 3/multisubunit Na+/H+ antiporter MnhD subunit n=2 Tax=Desulfobaculum xiamenense TaxID=995050 RepID=A0A846QMM7_9BACT|nr:formate hydrogenlyase subunit 3/multisubunit Na+/H+ antiporter MnhD subunit [Desulfobaculum xiamenense]
MSCVAEVGVTLVGFGAGSFTGIAGGALHLFYQLSIRALALVTLYAMYRKVGSFDLDRLRGMHASSPLMAYCFGFAMFAALGFTPFKGAVSRLAVVYGAIETGHLLSAILVLAGSIVAVWYTLKIVQAICFETSDAADAAKESAPEAMSPLTLLAGGLALLVAFTHAMPESLIHMVEGWVAASYDVPQNMPHFESPWPMAAVVPYVGGFLLLLVSRFAPKVVAGFRVRESLAVLLSGLSLVLVLATDAPTPLSGFFALIMAFIGLAVTSYSIGYMEGKENTDRYWFFLLLMQGSLVGLCMAGDLGSLYCFWELMTFTSYFLVIHEQTDAAIKAGFKYFFMCASGAYAMLFGLLLLHAQTGTFELAALPQAAATLAPGAAAGILFACLIGFAVKAGLMPLHSWLPEAHPVAPSSISAPLSGILTKTGIYGIVLVGFGIMGSGVMNGTTGALHIGSLLSLVGAVTLLYGEVMALRQTNVKRMLAYSTMAQVGEITVTLGLGTYLSVVGGLAHVMNHAIMKNLLFLCIGVVIMRAGSYSIDKLKGMGRVMPVTGVCFLMATLSVMGLPPFGGFASKFLMVYACLDSGNMLLACAILGGGLIGVLYYMRLVRIMFFEKYEGPAVAEAPATCLAPMAVLAFLTLYMGINPQALLGYVVPVADTLVASGKLAAQPLPDLSVPWPAFALIPMLGGIVPYFMRKDLEKCGWASVGVLVLSFVAVLFYWGSLDTVSLCYALLIVLMGILNTVYSVSYMDHSHTQWRYFSFLLLMIGGLLGVAGSNSLFSFFMFWEIMSSWTLYFVIIHEETEASLREGFKYFIFNVLGATFMFFGIVLLSSAAGSFEIGVLAKSLGQMPGYVGYTSMALIAIGFAMKAAMLPVRIDIWMHPATAPTPVSGYISSVLLKSGPFGLLKLFFILGGAGFFAGKSGIWGQPTIMYALAWVAGITIFYAAAMAVIQSGLKRMLIYSTVSQLGYIVLGICAGTSLTVSAGLLHFANHMFFKNLAFLCAGAIMYRTHADSLNQLSGIGRKMPLTLTVFAIAAFSAIGVPPFNGFTSKWMLYHGLMAEDEILLALLSLTGSVLTMAYFVKFLHSAFFGQPSEKLAHVTEVPKNMRVPMMILAGGCVLFGVFPGMLLAPINAIIADAGFAPLDISLGGVVSGAGSWNAVDTAILMGLAYGAARLVLHFMSKKERTNAIHTCGVNDLGPKELNISADNLYEPAITVLRQWISVPASLLAFNRKG